MKLAQFDTQVQGWKSADGEFAVILEFHEFMLIAEFFILNSAF